MNMAPPFQCYAKINEKILPIRRGEVYETPLTTALERSGLGTVEGGGTMQNKNKEIEYVGIDVVLQNKEEGVSFVCQFLEERGAPKGSVFQIGAEHFPFGKVEAVAVYFDGVNLPSEVYHDCDINFVWSEFEKRIGANGKIRGYWEGATETALYLYGASASDMRRQIADFLAVYPLCKGAQIVTFAPPETTPVRRLAPS
jgi:hypothetical protein